ncbi:MAG: hypothetical protein DSZ06_03395 [Sulfurospirillum sp.]|nr:MAG: hypothetical protein DSZ06_03395 [Sulfurospirillum sp.]
MDKLKDIRELEPIPDISIYIFIASILFALLVLGSIIYMIYRQKRAKKENLTKKEVLRRLKNIDFDDPKKAAYQITKYARFLSSDERSQKIFAQLEERLNRYKFIPNPPHFDEESKSYYNLFLEVVDE